MFVKPGHRQDDPALPLIVRGPNKRLLSPQGEHVPEITFWHRRVRDGDVVLAEPPPPPPPQPRPPAAVAAFRMNFHRRRSSGTHGSLLRRSCQQCR